MIGEIILNYKIEELIGEGGVGKVYLAIHQLLGRKVAIKVLNPFLVNHSNVRERFRQEATTLSSLQHLNIVTLYDYWEDGNGLYLIMEYVSGKSLDDYIRTVSGPIPETKAKEVFLKILEGIQYAHQKGIIHRDIKPSNILVADDGSIKILDFGIAKILKETEQNFTKTGSKIGTVLYMSPEQVEGKTIDIRTDIYALGVTLFQMLTGKPPYDEHQMTEYEIYSKIVKDTLPQVKEFYPAVSENLQNIITKATSKNPEDRFQNCEDFIKAIKGEIQITTIPHIVQPVLKEKEPIKLTTTPKEQHAKLGTKPRSNTILYLVLTIFMVLVLAFIINRFMDYGNMNQTITKNKKDSTSFKKPKNKKQDQFDVQDDLEKEKKEEDKEDKEKSPVQLSLDSVLDVKKAIESKINSYKDDRQKELLNGLLVDGQLEESKKGSMDIQLTILNKRKDAKFDKVIVSINYFDKKGTELKSLDFDCGAIEANKSNTFSINQMIDAAKFTCKLKNANAIDLGESNMLDSLTKQTRLLELMELELNKAIKEEKEKEKKKEAKNKDI